MRRRTSLARSATGLPRYYMDVHWWTGPAWLGATLAEIGLRDAMGSYCARHGTDGRLPADPRRLAVALAVDPSELRRTLKLILARTKTTETGEEVPVIAQDGDELVIAGYVDHNPSKADAEAYRAEKSAAGRRGNHQRHHVDKGVVNPDCELCQTTSPDPPPDRNSDRTCDPKSDRKRIAESSHGMGWDGIGDNPHPQTTSTGSDSQQRDEDRGKPPHRGDPADRVARADAACDLIADQAHQTAVDRGTVRDPDAHLAACIRGARRDHHAAAIQLAATRPDWTPGQIAEHLTRPVVERTTVPADQSAHPVLLAERLAPPTPPSPTRPTSIAEHVARARAAITHPGDHTA